MTAPALQGNLIRPRTGKGTGQGRPHLGPREVITAALWPGLEALVDDMRGDLDRSPFLADALARHFGRTDLIRHSQRAIEFSTTSGRLLLDAAKPVGAKTRHCTVRVHPDIVGELERGASDAGVPRGVFTAEVIAVALGVRGARVTTKEEGLPLAM